MEDKAVTIKDKKVMMHVKCQVIELTPKRCQTIKNSVAILFTLLTLKMIGNFTGSKYINDYVLLIGIIGDVIYLGAYLYKATHSPKGFAEELTDDFHLKFLYDPSVCTSSVKIANGQAEYNVFCKFEIDKMIAVDESPVVMYQLVGNPSRDFVVHYLYQHMHKIFPLNKIQKVKIAFMLDPKDDASTIDIVDNLFDPAHEKVKK